MEKLEDYKSCYVDNGYAYFTTKELSTQRGDDWDDAPYEHNAGSPYSPARPDLEDRAKQFPTDWNEDGTPKWKIIKIGFMADMQTPDYGQYNSPYSVEMINAGVIAWLSFCNWSNHKKVIHAGSTVKDLVSTIKEIGGEVYLPSNWEFTPQLLTTNP